MTANATDEQLDKERRAQNRARQLRDEAIGRAEQELTVRALALAARFGARPAVRVVTGDPTEALLMAAAEGVGSALIAMGSRGLGSFQRWHLGSVSTSVLHATTWPVLIVPPHQDANEPT